MFHNYCCKSFVIRSLFYYFTFFMFYFGATLLIATGYHSDVEIEQISNYRIAHLKI